MRYLGGKSKLSKQICKILESLRADNQVYVEPFAGGMSVVENMSGVRIAADSNKYVIAMYRALAEGWVPPESVSIEFYNEVKDRPEMHSDHMVGFVGFGCSFSGKFFGGYARGGHNSDGTPRNYCGESRRNVLKQIAKMTDVEFVLSDYTNLDIPKDSLVYADPPYAGTTGYGYEFDNAAFWRWAESVSLAGHTVVVSEYSAPARWEILWEKKKKISVDRYTSDYRTEKLYIIKRGEL